MGTISYMLMAFGVAMDAFAVSVASGVVIFDLKIKNALKIALFFCVFQVFMTIIGYVLADNFSVYIFNIDHWLCFILLCGIGFKMIYEAIMCKENIEKEPLKLRTLTALSIATSVDALAIGVSIAFISAEIEKASTYIGAITFITSFLGVYIGKKFGDIFEKKAEIFGGIILSAIGIHILIKHLFF